MRIALRWLALGLGLLLFVGASAPVQAAEPSVRRVRLLVGETFRTSTEKIRYYSFDESTDAAELHVADDHFEIDAIEPGQTVLVLIGDAGQSRLIEIDVAADPNKPPVTITPADAATLSSKRRVHRAQKAIEQSDYATAREWLTPALTVTNVLNEELDLLQAVCTQLKDKRCLKKLKAKRASNDWSDRR